MIGEVGTVRSPVGVRARGAVAALLAFAPEEADRRDGEPMIGKGR